MKLKIFLTIVIYGCMVLQSYGAKKKKEKINQKGKYLPYFGYSIVSLIDRGSMQVANQVEQYIRTSNLRRNFAALPASTYHMSVYTIYSVGNKLIPAVKRWQTLTGKKISDKSWLPVEALEDENNKAMCLLERTMNQPLKIKYATLKIGASVMSLRLEVEQESLDRIKAARKKLKRVYEHENKSMEPIKNNLHITLAYVYGNMGELDIDAWNNLNYLVRSFNGAKLLPPYVYQFGSMEAYYQQRKNPQTNCAAYTW